MHAGPPLVGLLRGGADHTLRAGVLGVDGKVGLDPPLPRSVPLVEQGQHLPHPAAGHRVLLRIEGLKGPAEIGLHAGSEDGPGTIGRTHIHVGEGGGARGKHLQHGQLHADPKVLLREPVLHGEYGVEQPLIEGQIAPQAPQKAHARVGVAVDEARQQELAGHVLRFVVGPPGRLGAHVVDPIPVDAQIAVPDTGKGILFPGQDIRTLQQSLHASFSLGKKGAFQPPRSCFLIPSSRRPFRAAW